MIRSGLIPLALAWLAYGLLHSALAAPAAKAWVARRWPQGVRYYRLGYNVVAVLALLPVLWLGHALGGAWLWRWTGAAAWLTNALALAAVAGFVWSSRHYDMAAFLGLRQLRATASGADGREAFVISPLHRYVRHPWYFLALVLVWTRDMTAATLVSSLMITLYFAIGSKFEERKLLAAHGDAYRRYMARVPGLWPLPWKTLSAAEAREIAG
ncbi:MAG: hypothetical protein HZC24_04565 [Rhodocyclales bacterium]|nr:hypothetical protein [Rhodocyclales bacterium]